jgi:hypothetical protein
VIQVARLRAAVVALNELHRQDGEGDSGFFHVPEVAISSQQRNVVSDRVDGNQEV